MSTSKVTLIVLVSLVFMSSMVFPHPRANRVLIPGSDAGGNNPKSMRYAPGEVLVKFRRGVSFLQVNRIAATKSLLVKKHFAVLSKLTGHEYVLISSPVRETMQLADEMRNQPGVADA